MSKARELDAHVGRNTRILRAAWNMNQADVAKAMNSAGHTWTRQTVSLAEAGQRPLLLNEAYDLAAVFHTSVVKLLSEVPL